MIKKQLKRVLKEGRLLNSSVSTAVNGLTAMNGDIRSLRRGILFLNIKITFCAARIALGRFLKSIKKNTWDRSE